MSVNPAVGSTWDAIKDTCAVGGTAQQITQKLIKDGYVTKVRAPIDNAGSIYVGSTQAKAEGTSGGRLTLSQGAEETFQINDTSLLWWTADNADDIIIVKVEASVDAVS